MSVQLVVASGSRAGQVIPIVGERFVIGRADDCHLKPRSELISRYHCEIFRKEGEVFIRDMGSKNGVFLNDVRIAEAISLKNGDKLLIGPLDFFVNIAGEMKPQKAERVKSVSDSVARMVALKAEDSKRSQEDTITDWLFAAGENSDDLETRTTSTEDLMAHLHTQEWEEREDSSIQPDTGSGIVPPGSHASSRDAASELLKNFFKGGR